MSATNTMLNVTLATLCQLIKFYANIILHGCDENELQCFGSQHTTLK